MCASGKSYGAVSALHVTAVHDEREPRVLGLRADGLGQCRGEDVADDATKGEAKG